jgi:hypothetical protein
MKIERKRPLYKSDAEECRVRGFNVGDQLIGDEGNGMTVIKITAIGQRGILAMQIAHNGEIALHDETNWTLTLRDWEKIPDGAPTITRAGGMREWYVEGASGSDPAMKRTLANGTTEYWQNGVRVKLTQPDGSGEWLIDGKKEHRNDAPSIVYPRT